MKKKADFSLKIDEIIIDRIRILKANIDAPEDNEIKSISFNINISHASGINLIKKKVKFDLSFDAEGLDDKQQPNGITGEFTLEFIFGYKDLESAIVQMDKDVLIVDASLSSTLLSLAYSTSRGVIFTRTLGTPLEGLIVPVLNPMKLLGKVETIKK